MFPLLEPIRYGGVPLAKGSSPALSAALPSERRWRAALSDRSTGVPDRHIRATPGGGSSVLCGACSGARECLTTCARQCRSFPSGTEGRVDRLSAEVRPRRRRGGEPLRCTSRARREQPHVRPGPDGRRSPSSSSRRDVGTRRVPRAARGRLLSRHRRQLGTTSTPSSPTRLPTRGPFTSLPARRASTSRSSTGCRSSRRPSVRARRQPVHRLHPRTGHRRDRHDSALTGTERARPLRRRHASRRSDGDRSRPPDVGRRPGRSALREHCDGPATWRVPGRRGRRARPRLWV